LNSDLFVQLCENKPSVIPVFSCGTVHLCILSVVLYRLQYSTE